MPLRVSKPHASRIAAHHQPQAVVLDFVNPVRPARPPVGGWEAGFDEVERDNMGGAI
jgi:hypothetical protein